MGTIASVLENMHAFWILYISPRYVSQKFLNDHFSMYKIYIFSKESLPFQFTCSQWVQKGWTSTSWTRTWIRPKGKWGGHYNLQWARILHRFSIRLQHTAKWSLFFALLAGWSQKRPNLEFLVLFKTKWNKDRSRCTNLNANLCWRNEVDFFFRHQRLLRYIFWGRSHDQKFSMTRNCCIDSFFCFFVGKEYFLTKFYQTIL